MKSAIGSIYIISVRNLDEYEILFKIAIPDDWTIIDIRARYKIYVDGGCCLFVENKKDSSDVVIACHTGRTNQQVKNIVCRDGIMEILIREKNFMDVPFEL